jgi:hypothetical protein
MPVMPGVQHLARRVDRAPRRSTIDLIADDGQAEGREVQADLVLASRLQLDLEQGARAEALDDAPARARLVGGLARTREPPPARLVDVVDGRVDLAFVGGGHPLHQGGVPALHAMRAEEVAQGRARGRAQGEGEGARGVAVEPVHDADVRPPRPPAGDVLPHPGQRRVLVARVGSRRHGEEPRRLVHHQDVVVLVQEGEGRARTRARLEIGIPGDVGAGLHQEAGLQRGPAADRDLALLDHVARPPARQLRMPLDQREVEADAHARSV